MRFERRYFRARKLFRSPLDGLNGRDAARLRAPWLTSQTSIPNKFGECVSKNSQGENLPRE